MSKIKQLVWTGNNPVVAKILFFHSYYIGKVDEEFYLNFTAGSDLIAFDSFPTLEAAKARAQEHWENLLTPFLESE